LSLHTFTQSIYTISSHNQFTQSISHNQFTITQQSCVLLLTRFAHCTYTYPSFRGSVDLVAAYSPVQQQQQPQAGGVLRTARFSADTSAQGLFRPHCLPTSSTQSPAAAAAAAAAAATLPLPTLVVLTPPLPAATHRQGTSGVHGLQRICCSTSAPTGSTRAHAWALP